MEEKKRAYRTYRISEVASELGISTVWLRKGEEPGFFPPARRDPTHGHRYYTAKRRRTPEGAPRREDQR